MSENNNEIKSVNISENISENKSENTGQNIGEISAKDDHELVGDAADGICVFKPEDIAEKLGVPANRIGVYARAFENLLEGHVETTEGGHRRYSSTAVRIMIELHMLIKGTNNKPGLSYKLANEEMARRLKKEASIGEELLPYETALQMKELSKVERELYGTLLQVHETSNYLVKKMDLLAQNHEKEKLEIFERMTQQTEEMTSAVKREVEQSQALHTLYLLKSQGKPSLISRIFGTRNVERENEVIKYCEEIIQRDYPKYTGEQKLIDE